MIYTEFLILFIQIYTEYLLRTSLFKQGDKRFFFASALSEVTVPSFTSNGDNYLCKMLCGLCKYFEA